MEQIKDFIAWVQPFFFETWVTIGTTEINLFRVLGLLFILIGVNWLAKFIETVIHKVFNNKLGLAMAHSSVYALGRIIRYVILFLGLVLGLSYIGFDLSSLAIIGGALGVGIGFGLQNIFNNLVSGVIILLEQTLKVGDFVDLESGVMGRVTEINMRYTRVTTNDEVDLIVPNSEFINGRVINWTLSNLNRRMHIPFGVAYGSDKELVKVCALKAAASVSYTIEDHQKKTDVWLTGFGDSSLDFALVVWVGPEGVKSPAKMEAQYLWALETELSKAGVEIPFPQRDLHVRSGVLDVNVNK